MSNIPDEHFLIRMIIVIGEISVVIVDDAGCLVKIRDETHEVTHTHVYMKR